MTHRHIWHWVQRARGVPPKRNMDDPIIFEGHIAECECGKRMFFPDDPRYKPQEEA